MSLAQEMAQKVLNFSKSDLRNCWLGDQFHIYVRNSTRDNRRVLDLASIDIDPDYQHQGLFKEFLTVVEGQSEVPLFIENVLNPHLRVFLTKRPGWVLKNPPGHWGTADSFYFTKER